MHLLFSNLVRRFSLQLPEMYQDKIDKHSFHPALFCIKKIMSTLELCTGWARAGPGLKISSRNRAGPDRTGPSSYWAGLVCVSP